MTIKIFLTGGTGYIGGDALYALQNAHPEYHYTLIVRNADQGAPVAARYPKVRLVYGDMESSDLLEEESAKTDIVIHTADSSDNVNAAVAISKGLVRGHTKENPGFWLHTGGTGILTYEDSEAGRFGELPVKEYNDVEGIHDLITLPDSAFHRNVDKIVLETASEAVKTAILCPPTIYGVGRGPGNTRGRQVYELVKTTLEDKKAPIFGGGQAEWDNCHIHDLSTLFLLLAQAAAHRNTSSDLWGPSGYYFAENGQHVWGDLSRHIAHVAHKKGFIGAPDVAPVDRDEAAARWGFELLSNGLNSKGRAVRARRFLGWSPRGCTLTEEVPRIVDSEARALGITRSHADVAAGRG